MQKKVERLKCIEGVRGGASLIIFVHHFAIMFYPAYYWGGIERSHCNGWDIWIGQTPFAFGLNGNSGVMIFLILIGFCTYIVFQNGEKIYTKYILLRYIKLLLLTIVASIIVWVLLKLELTFFSNIIEEVNTPWFDGWNIQDINYFGLLIRNPIVSLQKYNNTLWTMEYIFVGSMISILICIATNQCRNKWLIYVISVLILVNRQQIYYIPCIVGVFLADIYQNKVITEFRDYIAIFLVLLGIYLCAYPTEYAPILKIYSFLPFKHVLYYHIIGAGCIVSTVLFWRRLRNIMESRLMQVCGTYSMSIYLVQYSVLISFSAWYFSILREYIGYNSAVIFNFIATCLVLIVVAYFVKKLIDVLNCCIDKIYNKILS